MSDTKELDAYWRGFREGVASMRQDDGKANVGDCKSSCEGSSPSPVSLKPFRAWVAWHPERGVSESSFSLRLEDCTALVNRYDLAEGWRVIEVEVREVGE